MIIILIIIIIILIMIIITFIIITIAIVSCGKTFCNFLNFIARFYTKTLGVKS